MPKRIFWLLLTAVLPTFILSFLIMPSMAQETAVPQAAPHDIIINEWSQGNGNAKEWVELLIVNGPIDMRGWDMGDSTPGDLVFADNPLWSSVPAGNLIVIYNGSDPDTILPPDDANLDDCVAIISDEETVYFGGSLASLSNSNADDVPHLRDETDTTIHDFSAEPGNGLALDAHETARYDGAAASGVSISANWSVVAASTATPGSGNGGDNSAWINALCRPEADLILEKSGPATAAAGATIVYQISLHNQGSLAATDVILTDTLPAGLSYVSDDSGYSLSQPGSNQLVWLVGAIPTNTLVNFNLTATIDVSVSGSIVNEIVATTAVSETNLSNNNATAVTAIGDGTIPAILINAVLYDGLETDEPDEAVQLYNSGQNSVDIGGWQLSDGGIGKPIAAGTSLAPGQTIWLARDVAAFTRQFGFAPDMTLAEWPGFSNNGDEVVLLNADGAVIDALVYDEDGDISQEGWLGAAIAHYNGFGESGQILYRKRDQATGLPVPDTDTAADWAQGMEDVVNGRKPRYPGWDLDEFFFTAQVTETAVLTVAIAPDNAYETIVNEINKAVTSLNIESHTFENIAISNALIQAAQRGVSVTILLEGAPPGGLPDQEKYICQQIEAVNGRCWFMISDSSHTPKIFDRYTYIHAKFILIDDQRVIISSENLSANSMPDDDKGDGTWGRRGVALITDAPGVVSHVQTIFDRDFDIAHHHDITGTTYIGSPPDNFIPITQTGGITYSVRFTMPAVFTGAFPFELVQSPENSLRDQDGLLGLVNRAEAGDTVLVQQLREPPDWGDNPTDDPNPRLEAYIGAARRGARVQLLLDAYFDDAENADSNAATCLYVNAIAQDKGLELKCALGNPTGLGIHNKMVLAQIGGKGYIHVGSINGSEQSSKGNRELALQVQSDGAYALLADMFYRDWPHRTYLPIMLNNYIGPANHILISEILYDLPDAEFIELANPTSFPINLSNYSLGDAVNRSDYEDVRRFPSGTTIAARSALLVATTATGFNSEFGFNPDFEILDTDPTVPNMIDDTSWGDTSTFLRLGNSGDEVILRNPVDQAIDVVTYGTGSYPGNTACLLSVITNASLERLPYWRDTDDCTADFWENAFPTPGTLPE